MHLTKRQTFYVDPGFVYFSKKATLLRAVVGSCVAVCLWDKQMKCGGMNHFMKPSAHDKSEATPVYGNAGIAALIKMMEEAGCEKGNVVAHILGGGAPDGETSPTLGEQNVAAARVTLTRKQIAILAEDVGGPVGRKIAFDTATGELAVLKTTNVRTGDWFA